MNNISNMPRLLQSYINDELHNAELYRILAKSAPNERDKHVLEEFSQDSRQTADAFMSVYRSMTGYPFEPNPAPIKENGSYKSVLRSRIRDETEASKRFRREYMNTSDNLKLKRAFFTAYHNALGRAVGIIDLIM